MYDRQHTAAFVASVTCGLTAEYWVSSAHIHSCQVWNCQYLLCHVTSSRAVDSVVSSSHLKWNFWLLKRTVIVFGGFYANTEL